MYFRYCNNISHTWSITEDGVFLTKSLYPVGKHQTLKLYLLLLYNHTYLENYSSLKAPVYNCFVTVSEPIQYTTYNYSVSL